jgi:hypothetical protein
MVVEAEVLERRAQMEMEALAAMAFNLLLTVPQHSAQAVEVVAEIILEALAVLVVAQTVLRVLVSALQQIQAAALEEIFSIRHLAVAALVLSSSVTSVLNVAQAAQSPRLVDTQSTPLHHPAHSRLNRKIICHQS